MSQPPLRIGALAPLSRPDWAEAGRHLLTGLELAVGDSALPIELLVRDTAADPDRAAAAVDELADLGVAAIVGGSHGSDRKTIAESWPHISLEGTRDPARIRIRYSDSSTSSTPRS